MSLYAPQGGANREIKKWFAQKDGVNREIKSLWAQKDGANRKVFSNEITWTHTIQNYDVKPADSYTYVTNDKHTLYISRDTVDNPAGGKVIDYIATYTFSEPLTMRAGETLTTYFLSGNSNGTRSYGCGYLYINNNNNETMDFSEPAREGDAGENYGNSSYVFPSDIAIQTITVRVHMTSEECIANNAMLDIKINSSEYGSFLLDSTGSSN